MPGVRMLWIVTTKLIAPASDEMVRMCSPRIHRSGPFPGMCRVESGVYIVQPPRAGPFFAKKLSISTTPPRK